MRRLLTLHRGFDIRLGGSAVIDQAVVSGTNFLITVIVGRLCGPTELGLFALVTTIWYLVLAFLESAITSPFAVFVHRLADQERSAYAGSAIAHVIGLSSIATAVIGLLTVVLVLAGLHPACVSTCRLDRHDPVSTVASVRSAIPLCHIESQWSLSTRCRRGNTGNCQFGFVLFSGVTFGCRCVPGGRLCTYRRAFGLVDPVSKLVSNRACHGHCRPTKELGAWSMARRQPDHHDCWRLLAALDHRLDAR